MVNSNLIAAKLSELSDKLQRVESHCPANVQILSADQDALDLIAFNLMIAVQLCADISSHIIVDQGWPVARTLGGGFDRLRDNGVIGSATAEALVRAVGFRNVVAHGYAGVDVGIVYKVATKGLEDLRTFAQEVARWVS